MITVEAGTIAAAAVTLINKSVTIAGTGIGSTVIQPTGIGFRVLADDVTIKDLTIEGGSQAIRFELANGTIDGTTIESVQMLDNTSRGIEVHNATTVTNLLIVDSSFENTNIGLRVSSSGHIDGAEFRDSLFDGNVIGIYEANDAAIFRSSGGIRGLAYRYRML